MGALYTIIITLSFKLFPNKKLKFLNGAIFFSTKFKDDPD